MFVIEVAFPTGRCYGASFDKPDQPEWPIHPSRLFSALVASACQAGGGLNDARRAALLWLEQQGPPAISAPAADVMAAPTNYVPPADFNVQQGKVEHPVFRLRKDRYFPSAYLLGEPVVRYVWQSEPDIALLSTLDEIASGVTHVGTSHSMAIVSASIAEGVAPTYLPDKRGRLFLRVPTAGRLEELLRNYTSDLGVRRPPQENEVSVPYLSVAGARVALLTSPFDEFIPLRIRGLMHCLDSAESLTRAFRRSVMSRVPDPIPEIIHGHMDGPHVAWLPLSDVGHENARGRIIGVGIAIPKAATAQERRLLLAALAVLEKSGVHLDDGRDVFPEPLNPEHPVPRSLETRRYTAGSRTWATVTPVIPDRLPKTRKTAEIAATIRSSLVRAGYPEPEDVLVSEYSAFMGAPSTREYRLRLPRFHAVVTFPTEVQGPVLAGRLRYFGIGLFRPLKGGAR